MHITGLVGYHGKHRCQLYCGMARRRECTRGNIISLRPLKHPKLLRSRGVCMLTSTSGAFHHRRVNSIASNLHYLVTSPNESQYRARCLATGISKPSILSGLDCSSTLGLPHSAGSDIMHLGALNLSDFEMISFFGEGLSTAPGPMINPVGPGLSCEGKSGSNMAKLLQTPFITFPAPSTILLVILQKSSLVGTKLESFYSIFMDCVLVYSMVSSQMPFTQISANWSLVFGS